LTNLKHCSQRRTARDRASNEKARRYAQKRPVDDARLFANSPNLLAAYLSFLLELPRDFN
jgi:hypothetical protein